MSSRADWIGNGLAAWVRFILRFRNSTLLIWFALCGLSIHYAAGNLGIDTDTADMISAELPWRQHFIEYRERFPARVRNLVIVIDAESAWQADAFAADLAGALRGEPDIYRSVFLPGDGEFFERNGLLYLGIAELERLTDRLAEAQPLFGLLERRFNGSGVVEVVTETVEASGIRDAQGSDELQALYEEITRSLEAASSGERYRVGWQRLISGEETGSARRIVLLQPSLDFSRVQPAGPAIERLRALIAELGGRDVDSPTVRLTGTIAMEHEELVSVSRGAALAGLSALVLVALVLYWALRSIRLLAISVVTLLGGLAMTAAFAALAVGHLNLLSVAFAVLYVGLGVDFVLHFCLRFKELVAAGKGVESAIVETARGVGASLLICAVTTSAGFYSFIPTPFEGVSELGLISGTGMFISLLVSLSLLPALVAAFVTPASSGRARRWLGNHLATSLTSYPKAGLVAAFVVMALTFSVLPGVSFDNNPIHLRDPNSESVLAIQDLAGDSEAPLLNMVALAADRETALGWAAELEAQPAVREVLTFDSLVPAEQADKAQLIEDIGLLMGPGFGELERLPADPATLRRQLRSLGDALDRERADSDDLADPGERALQSAVDRFLGSVDETAAPAAASLLTALDEDLTADLPGQLRRLAAGLEGRPFTRGDLPAELAERWVDGAGNELIEIVPAENINDNAAAARFVAAVRGIVPEATGLPVVYQEASATIVRSFQLALSYALVTVTVLLAMLLRRGRDVLLVLGPILFAAGTTAGLTVWLGIPFNFANIIALPLLVGVGVDSGVHMVHRMRTEPPADGEPLGTSTPRAVLASGLTTIASFGNLAFSAHLGMASMGKLLTLGMTVTLVATLLLLPALLKLQART